MKMVAPDDNTTYTVLSGIPFPNLLLLLGFAVVVGLICLMISKIKGGGNSGIKRQSTGNIEHIGLLGGFILFIRSLICYPFRKLKEKVKWQ